MPEAIEIISARAWTGGGQPVTGAEAARHLDLTIKVLERDGWIRDYNDAGPDPLRDLTKSSSLRDMLFGLVAAIRDLGSDRGPHTLLLAMYRATEEGSDADSRFAAECCIEAAIRSRYGLTLSDTVSVNAWATRQGRTFDEVRELLAEAAELARTHGPTA